LSGYLKSIYETDRPLWEKTLDLMASDHALAPMVPETTWRTGTTERAGQRVLELAERNVIGPGHLRLWNFGTEIRKLSPELLSQWVDYLLNHEAGVARPIGLELFHRYYSGDHPSPPMPPELAKKLLLHPDYLGNRQRGGVDELYWAEIANRLITEAPEFAVKLLEGVLEQWTTPDASLGGTPNPAASLLYEVVKEHPTESWQAISRLIRDLRSTRTWLIMKWLQGHSDVSEDIIVSAFTVLNFDDVARWVNKARRRRARFLARYVPKSLTESRGMFTRQFLARYGDDKEVRHELMVNFSTVGFWGAASDHYQEAKDRLVALRKQETDKNLRKFLDEYIGVLDRRVEDWKVREERAYD
jgi:hypothetical protein